MVVFRSLLASKMEVVFSLNPLKSTHTLYSLMIIYIGMNLLKSGVIARVFQRRLSCWNFRIKKWIFLYIEKLLTEIWYSVYQFVFL